MKNAKIGESFFERYDRWSLGIVAAPPLPPQPIPAHAPGFELSL